MAKNTLAKIVLLGLSTIMPLLPGCTDNRDTTIQRIEKTSSYSPQEKKELIDTYRSINSSPLEDYEKRFLEEYSYEEKIKVLEKSLKVFSDSGIIDKNNLKKDDFRFLYGLEREAAMGAMQYNQ